MIAVQPSWFRAALLLSLIAIASAPLFSRAESPSAPVHYPPEGFQRVADDDDPAPKGYDIEAWRKGAEGKPALWQVWISSHGNPPEHLRLLEYPGAETESAGARCEKLAFFVSPDENWLVWWQKREKSDALWLYRRKSGIVFERATAISLDQMAWNYWIREAKPGAGEPRNATIAFRAWIDGSAKLRFELDGNGEGWAVAGWTCDCDLRAGKFQVPP